MKRYKILIYSIVITLFVGTYSIMLFKKIKLDEKSKFVNLSVLPEKEKLELRQWGFRRGKNYEPPIVEPFAKQMNDVGLLYYIGNAEEKNIFLTFDCGYENGNTELILNILRDKEIKAIFFITLHYLEKNKDMVERMLNEGHYIGNHTARHSCLPKQSIEEIKNEMLDLEVLFYQIFDKKMDYFRPPEGEYNYCVLEEAKELGYKTLFWSNAYDDWNVNLKRGWNYGYNKLIKNIHNGAVILLHPVSPDNVDLMEKFIDETRTLGFEIQDPKLIFIK